MVTELCACDLDLVLHGTPGEQEARKRTRAKGGVAIVLADDL